MKKIKYILFALVAGLLFSSCNKQIQEKENNPNKPSTVPPDLILGTVLTAMSGSQGSSSIGALGGINSWDNVHDWNQYHCQNYNYYGNNIYAWTDNSVNSDGSSAGPFNAYLVLKNVVQMENEVTSNGGAAVNPYEAVGRFIMAFYYYNLTSLMGDVPLTQALDAPANAAPSYTSQEQVFGYVLNELDSANTDLTTLIAAADNSLSSSQDIYYAGNLVQWQKAVN